MDEIEIGRPVLTPRLPAGLAHPRQLTHEPAGSIAMPGPGLSLCWFWKSG